MVPSEQSVDLRDYLSKHTKTDRLDAELLSRLPVLHPEGLHVAEALGPGDPLKRAVKIRAGLVHRRSTAMHRLDPFVGWLGTLSLVGFIMFVSNDGTDPTFLIPIGLTTTFVVAVLVGRSSVFASGSASRTPPPPATNPPPLA